MANKSNKKAKKVKPTSGKSGKTKGGKQAKTPTRPRSSEMVLEALGVLREKKGSSLQAIKKYITTTYRIDMAKQSPHIKKYIKNAVVNNEIVQTKGNGASGRFRLPTMADLQRLKQQRMPKKPPSKKQAPVKPSSATKKGDARKNPGGKSKGSVNKKGGKPMQKPAVRAPKNSKK